MKKSKSMPPGRRTPAWDPVTVAAADGRLILPRCSACGTIQYPLQETCRRCLGDDLEWVEVPTDGTLLSWTRLRASLEPFFREHLPWPLGWVKLACGPVLLAHLADESPASGKAVRVLNRPDTSGVGVLIAVPTETEDSELGRIAALLAR